MCPVVGQAEGTFRDWRPPLSNNTAADAPQSTAGQLAPQTQRSGDDVTSGPINDKILLFLLLPFRMFAFLEHLNLNVSTLSPSLRPTQFNQMSRRRNIVN